MTRQEKAGAAAAFAAAAAITGYSAFKLLGTGILSWHVAQPEFYSMAAELLAVWLLLFLLFYYGKDRRVRLASALVVVMAEAWLHVVFLPVLSAGLYVCYLIAVGNLVSTRVVKRKLGVSWNFMLGTAVTVTVFCLFSLPGISRGSIPELRTWVVGSGLLLVFLWLLGKWRERRTSGKGSVKMPAAGDVDQRTSAGRNSRLPAMTAMMLSAVVMLLILQMCRMNGAIDFDSLWYGVRSDVMLNSGNGIYEDLGTLGVVYTYPKGWETLTLPLAGIPSYSFPIAFNVWAAALTLAAAYETAGVRMEKRVALWVPFLMAAVPGIMNMCITAKADIMTLFFQVLMVQGMLRYEKERQTGWLYLGLAAGGMSLTMKPTAVIFSTAIVGIGLLWLLWDCLESRRWETGAKRYRAAFCREMLLLIPAATALAGIWGRTLKLVGVPVTSVFYQLFQKIGFQVKYPFYAAGFPAAGDGMSGMDKIRFFAGRLYGVLLNPQGDDMGHVVIAWGSVIPVVLLVWWLAMTLVKRPLARADGRRAPGFLQLLLPAVIFINLVSLYSLYQIDGNYYILFYFLVILAGCALFQENRVPFRKAVCLSMLPAWFFAVVVCCLTNWAWALGMGGIHPFNKGYYNHIEAEREKRALQGSGAIWDILAAEPKNRVVALGEHPGVLTFPCSVQSYVDVSGYWGNPDVVSSAPEFLRYLHFAKTDYLYMEKEYVDASVRIYQIVRALVAEGWLTDVRDENGNLILTVLHDGPDTDNAAQNLDVFDNRYIQHP